MSADLTRALREKALAEGFSDFGICRPDAVPETAARLSAFVEKGHHGQMGWMAERMHGRGAPSALWPMSPFTLASTLGGVMKAFNSAMDLTGSTEETGRPINSPGANSKSL